MTGTPTDLSSPPAGPIADVSYRNYDGPLRRHHFRWWVIARMMASIVLRRKGFWVLAALSVIPYLLPGFQLYLMSRMPGDFAAMLARRPLNSVFYDAYAGSQLWQFLLALMAGAAIIAGDNRTNALQIYLARPITKGDYLTGKWMSVFLVLAATSLVPAVLLFLYCLASFSGDRFLDDHPRIWLQILGTCLLPPVLHASLIVGFSSCFKRPLMAGGIYAAFYFGLQVVTGITSDILWKSGKFSETIGHLSLPGVLRGLGQHFFDATPTFFGLPIPPRGGTDARPDLTALLIFAAVLVVLGLTVARLRIRAVEVVKG